MQAAVVTYVTMTVCVVISLVVGLQLTHIQRVNSGGIMSWLAHRLTRALGRITFAALHLFEKVGIDMSAVDVALAGWTSYAQELKNHSATLQGQLEEALARIQQLIALDATEDAAQAAALQEEIAAQITESLELVKNPPVEPEAPEEPETPAEPEVPEVPEEVVVPIVEDESEPVADPEQP